MLLLFLLLGTGMLSLMGLTLSPRPRYITRMANVIAERMGLYFGAILL
jgi:hypothetical protein